MRSGFNAVLYALIAAGALAGLYGGVKRFQVESRNRRVELALDYAEVKTLAETSGQPIRSMLARFKPAGITSVAITEDTLASLETRGAVAPVPASAPSAATHVTNVQVASGPLLSRITAAVRARGFGPPLPQRSSAVTAFHLLQNSVPEMFGADYAILRPLGMGLDPDSVADVTAAGLRPVARIANWPGVSPASMAAVLGSLKALGVHTVVFQGVEVMGFRGQEKETAAALEASGIRYGQIEFGKQKGDEKLGAALKGEFVRVHSVSDAEMGMLDENEVIDRFVRAARERNIRLCYVRLPFLAGADPVSPNLEFLQKIRRGIARGGEMRFGEARLFGETGVPGWAFLLMGLGAGAGLALLVVRIVARAGAVTAGTAAVLIIGCGALAFAGGESGRKLAALGAALAFPTLACLRRDLLGAPDAPNTPASGAVESMRRALAGLAQASAVTAVGIAMVVGLLATRPFMLKANQFLGIKAAHAIPILIIGALAITRLPAESRPWQESASAIRARLKAFFGQPARVGQILLAIIALAGLALVVARTGNDPGVGVSGMELKFRALLDRFLPVRPRTKEFLIGHPAFVLALALWFRGRRAWAVPLFVVGVLGQVSLLNTFCHIHTPLTLSLVRDVTGLVFGAIIGLAAFWIIERALPAPSARAE